MERAGKRTWLLQLLALCYFHTLMKLQCCLYTPGLWVDTVTLQSPSLDSTRLQDRD